MPKGKVLVKDKQGNTLMVSVNDERYLNGELVFFWKGRHHTEQGKENKRKTYKEKRYQDGEKNSQFGSMWVTNGKKNWKVSRDNKTYFNEHSDTFKKIGIKNGRKLSLKKKIA